MISQLKAGKSLDSEDEDDVFNDSFGKLSSILDDSSESSGREKVLLDLNFDPKPSQELPGLVAQVGKSSISELRELRNSIDQSLQQPQNLKKDSARGSAREAQKRRSLFKKQESDELSEVAEELETEREIAKAPKKSPFKNAVESGSSDLESIDFEVIPKPVERLRGRKVSFKTPSASSSSSSSSSSSLKTPTESSSDSSRSSSSSSSSTIRDSSSPSSNSSSSSNLKIKNDGKYEDDFEDSRSFSQPEEKSPSEMSSDSISIPSPPKRRSPPPPPPRRKSERSLSVKTEERILPPDEPKKMSSSAAQTDPEERRAFQEALLVSDGVQSSLRQVMQFHIEMVEEMNRLEWATLNKWQQELSRLRADHNGPSMARLKALIDERINRK